MKTSVMQVHDMLSVLSVHDVEKRIGEVPGVESVTVNFSAENATVRYDETRLVVADIKSAVRQRGNETADASAGNGHGGQKAPVAAPATPAPSAPKTGAATAATGDSSAGIAKKTDAPADAEPSTPEEPSAIASTTVAASKSTTPKSAPDAATIGDEQSDKAGPGKS